jgi:hypothetical protein
MQKYNISKEEEKNFKMDYERFCLVFEEGIQLHSFRSGICVCKECHVDIDERYRRYKKDERDENH